MQTEEEEAGGESWEGEGEEIGAREETGAAEETEQGKGEEVERREGR